MELKENQKLTIVKRGTTIFQPFQSRQNLSKKRPSTTKLDLEKMYEQSLELAAVYKKLTKQNLTLKDQYQKIEAVKLNRQNLISLVQKIVEQKSKELPNKNKNQNSWLVFKLNSKIYELKSKIEQKQKAIQDLMLNKENEAIRQKQSEIQCLDEIINFAKKEGLADPNLNARQSPYLSDIKEIVWMEQQISQKESEILEVERLYSKQQKEVRKLMQQLAKKKAELKSIKQMENTYNKAQQIYQQEKKKKQQKMAGNKTYLEELQNQRNEQVKKLQQLQVKFKAMELEQKQSILNLEAELQKLKNQYQIKLKNKQDTVIRFTQEITPINNKKMVKRVSYNQIETFTKNLNYWLALKQVSPSFLNIIFSQQKEEYSIRQICDILRLQPFCIKNELQRLLIARYVVEDNGNGYFLQDMETTQSSHIIRSIFSKLIGQIKIYDKVEAEQNRKRVGDIMLRFGKTIQQSLDSSSNSSRRQQKQKQASLKQYATRDKLNQAFQSNFSTLKQQNFHFQDREFVIFYLFSWSKNIEELQMSRLLTMHQININWPE